ncbi:MAG: hypothetical protein IPF73_12940 [Betaproteobacteria bacterium]|nr:hypothetical protein [Betaproteobacteria bacterium]
MKTVDEHPSMPSNTVSESGAVSKVLPSIVAVPFSVHVVVVALTFSETVIDAKPASAFTLGVPTIVHPAPVETSVTDPVKPPIVPPSPSVAFSAMVNGSPGTMLVGALVTASPQAPVRPVLAHPNAEPARPTSTTRPSWRCRTTRSPRSRDRRMHPLRSTSDRCWSAS